MKKFTKIIALALAVVLAFSLAACSNSGNGGAYGIAPADGIVVIRQHKEVAA